MSKPAQYRCPGVIGGPAGLIKPGADGIAVVDDNVAEWLDERIEAGALPGVARVTAPESFVTDPAGGVGDEATGDGVDADDKVSSPATEHEPAKPAPRKGRGKANPGVAK